MRPAGSGSTPTMSRLALALVVGLVPLVALACGGSGNGGGSTPQDVNDTSDANGTGGDSQVDDSSSGTGPDHDDSSASGATARTLGITATYAHLVDLVRRLDEQGASASESSCILRGGAGGGASRLEAELAAAIHPIPRPPADFAPRLTTAGGGVTALTRWGARGEGELAVVALTATPPTGEGPVVVVFVGRDGVWLRRTDGGLEPTLRGPFPLARLGDQVAAASVGASSVMVTLEAPLPIGRLRTVLEGLPASAPPVSLGLLLSADTRLPRTTPPSQSESGMCSHDPLPELGANDTVGELTVSELRAAFGPLAESGRRCLAVASGTGARGGRLAVRFRIGSAGRVVSECALQDGIGDATLRACILHAVHGLTFPRPRGGDHVEVSVPVVLRPDDALRQAPLCD